MRQISDALEVNGPNGPVQFCGPNGPDGAIASGDIVWTSLNHADWITPKHWIGWKARTHSPPPPPSLARSLPLHPLLHAPSHHARIGLPGLLVKRATHFAAAAHAAVAAVAAAVPVCVNLRLHEPTRTRCKIVKQVGVYKLIELDISTGVYSDVHTVQLDTAVDADRANPSFANAFAINPTNDIAYGKFTDSSDQDFFCRFAANQTAEPMECLCALSAAGNGGAKGSGELNSATIVNDIYYVGMGTRNLRIIPNVSTCFYDTSCFAPGAPSPFTQCPGAWIFGNRADGFGDSLSFAVGSVDFDISALKLDVATHLTAQFGWNELDYSTNSRYLKDNLYTYDSATGSVSAFRPSRAAATATRTSTSSRTPSRARPT